MKSWKTTLAGVVIGLAMLFGELRDAVDTDPNTVFELTILIEALAVMGIGWFARDNDKSSESVGAQ